MQPPLTVPSFLSVPARIILLGCAPLFFSHLSTVLHVLKEKETVNISIVLQSPASTCQAVPATGEVRALSRGLSGCKPPCDSRSLCCCPKRSFGEEILNNSSRGNTGVAGGCNAGLTIQSCWNRDKIPIIKCRSQKTYKSETEKSVRELRLCKVAYLWSMCPAQWPTPSTPGVTAFLPISAHAPPLLPHGPEAPALSALTAPDDLTNFHCFKAKCCIHCSNDVFWTIYDVWSCCCFY